MQTPAKSFMRCVSFCTAGSYDLNGLANSFKRSKAYIVKQSRDVVHIISTKKLADIFFFSHGSFVCWGLKKSQEQKFIDHVKAYSVNRLERVEIDYFFYHFGEETAIDAHERFKLDVITLDSDSPQLKLAISYGLAQSIKLVAFEDAIQDTIRKNSYLPEELALKGSVSLPRNALFKRVGEIFLARSSINLSIEYLDVPEFFWRNPNLEPFYIMTKKFLDIPSRVMALNQKLDVLQELLDILHSQVQHRHSSMLEIIIILLIAFEIVINLVHHSW